MKLLHTPTAVAWGARRGDHQVGSIVDQRETYRLDRRARAIATQPVVAHVRSEYANPGRECLRCGDDGMIELGVRQDSFGNWETVDVPCDCPAGEFHRTRDEAA